MKSTVLISMNYLTEAKNRVVRFVISVGTLQFFALQGPNMQWQPFFARFFSEKISFGFLFVGISICFSIGAGLAPWFLKKCKRNERKALVFSQTIIGIGLVLTTIFHLFPLTLSMFLIHELARGVFQPLKEIYLTKNIPLEEGATLRSFGSLSEHLGGAIDLVISGWVAEQISIPCSWALSGSILAIGATLLLRNSQ